MACPGCGFDGADNSQECPRCRAAATGGRIRPAKLEESSRADALLRADAVLALTGAVSDDLSASERRIVRLIDGVRPVARIRRRSGTSSVELRVVIAVLHQRGLVRLAGFVEHGNLDAPPDAAAEVFSPRALAEIQAMIAEDEGRTVANTVDDDPTEDALSQSSTVDSAEETPSSRGRRTRGAWTRPTQRDDLEATAGPTASDPLSPERQHLGVPLAVLANAAKGLDADAIAARFGRAFMVSCARDPGTGADVSVSAFEDDPTGSLQVTVFFARRRAGSDQLVVTIGRGAGNDISFTDESVSRFHAYLKEGADGCYHLQDAKSLHGTTVDETAVAARGSGPPTELRNGQTIRFGAVSTIFVDAAGLLPLLRRGLR